MVYLKPKLTHQASFALGSKSVYFISWKEEKNQIRKIIEIFSRVSASEVSIEEGQIDRAGG